ncbi:yippee zinc-binding/DNA-binding /Mis18, centromere assembly-domain-containing protein [Corynascus novoguineensis]|uniref:Yippee zinc-binding/DNA-binding /Mis18, centromere assembly-domain-containing protein n=1 Tax=Corynascus novoguineensis TaxID=1126955 RepID=A0AAN7CT14_9PEZI|nr:yippee zinc-binding/DNA-binding /Mis18, centromere assembly-domain-containing protein [Corynascus novoguineensis]
MSTASSTKSKPSFPLYLLPSLRIPFNLRRTSEPSASKIARSLEPLSPATDDTVPSLSTSPASICPTSPTTPSSSTGRRLSRARPDTLRCRICSVDLAFHSQIVSKCFTGRNGRAYLVAPPSPLATPSCPASPLNSNNDDDEDGDDDESTTAGNNRAADLINVRVGRPETRTLITGVHVVADISCAVCGATVGWKYIDAREWSQKYKVGKFILETRRVVGHRGWEDVADDGAGDNGLLEGAVGGNVRDLGNEDGEGDEDDEAVVFDSEDEDECEDMFLGVWDAKVVARRRKSRSGDARRWW